MPLYEYACPDCGIEVERLTTTPPKTGEDAPRCDRCAAEMSRQPSAPSFVLRGFKASNGYSRKDS